ncbi:MAG: type II toxin-antitoxin system VapC family toxin [Chloroflexi bacterium]|nr:type II toxin-antitoxin system VapC family toxin [Chloroflexota bacterium]
MDTDWVIHYFNRVGPVVDRIAELTPRGLGMSVISLAELYEGVLGAFDPPRSEAEVQAFLERVDLLEVDDAVCRIFGRERRRLRAEGNLIGDLDLLIGSTALRHGLTVLTNNRRHFERIEGLAIESV